MRSKRIKYPPWVTPSATKVGDVSFHYNDEAKSWDKFVFAGAAWINWEAAPSHIKLKSTLRKNQLIDNQYSRKA